jgi:hypothetical protein
MKRIQSPIQLVPGAKRWRGVRLTTHTIEFRGQERVGAIPPLLLSSYMASSGQLLIDKAIIHRHSIAYMIRIHNSLDTEALSTEKYDNLLLCIELLNLRFLLNHEGFNPSEPSGNYMYHLL